MENMNAVHTFTFFHEVMKTMEMRKCSITLPYYTFMLVLMQIHFHVLNQLPWGILSLTD